MTQVVYLVMMITTACVPQQMGGEAAGVYVFLSIDGGALTMPVLANPRHELFCHEIVKGNGVLASYAAAGYEKPSDNNASRLRGDERVCRRIAELLEDAALAAGVTSERVIKELAAIAFADITEAVHWGEAVAVPIMNDGEMTGEYAVMQAVVMVPSKDLPKGTRQAIREVRKTKEGIAIKMHSKTDALGKLASIFGMNKDKSGDGGDMANTTNIQINAGMSPQEMSDLYVQLVRGS